MVKCVLKRHRFADSQHPWGRPCVNQVYDFDLGTKVKDQAHKHWAHSEAALISHSNTNDVFTSDRQRGPSEFLMKALFEILNKLKLIHDFLMGPVEASRIADCFSPMSKHPQRRGEEGKKGGHDSGKFLPFSPPHALHTNFKKPISCPAGPRVIASNSVTL